MLFKDIIQQKDQILEKEFSSLIEHAYNNSAHKGDLLLLHINGFFDYEHADFYKDPKNNINPHVIGPGEKGHSELSHYRFIDQYRTTSIIDKTYSEYLDLLEEKKKDKKHINELIEYEETTIQIEMLIYLKFWEADAVIKRFYEFARLLNGEPYDWYFRLPDSLDTKDCTGTRQAVIRNKIRDKMKDFSNVLYEMIKKTYKTQIRNAIAHSNYSFSGRNIWLLNYNPKDKFSNIQNITFDEWIDIFHNTLLLHNHYLGLKRNINEYYVSILDESNRLPVRIVEKEGNSYDLFVEYRREYDDWSYVNE